MHYGNIKKCDIANGAGVRVTLFVSGCTNRCKGCFQPETWDFCYGKEYTQETEDEVLGALKLPNRAGLTILGGEPFEPENQRELIKLMKRVKKELPTKNIWVFTGFVYDRDLVPGGRKHCEVTNDIMSMIDVLVDGPFIEDKKNLMLRFRGSENQRIIDMNETRKSGKLVLSKEYHN
jgi:anaerobic ribonucleoside-triphosphate reductase activating protein